MNFSRPKTASSTGAASKPVIRKTTVQVPIKSKVVSAAASPSNGISRQPPARPTDPNRWKPSNPSQSSRKPLNPAKRALSNPRGTKRKSATPPVGPLFSSDSEDDGSSDIGGSDSDASRKRLKSSPSSVESVGPRRHLLCEKAFAEEAVIDIVHGADATSGEYEKKFRNLWQDEDFETVTLQYPSLSQRERFELKHPVNAAEDYKPLDDITETVKIIVLRYFPSHLHTLYSHDETGYERRFNRALQRQSVADFIEVLHDFNNTLHTFLKDGTIQAHLRTHRALDLDWVERILGQIYARTVSPKVESLRAYQNGSDNVYGELLPRFCSEIFQKTALNHEQIFIDLGSGVGNVVLQAALEIGCESWGIEMMPNPCELAALQAKEFPARSRLWGLSVGDVHLLKGDFTNSPPEIESVFKRADVVLVNNQAFTPQLNDKLRDKFLDLKNGCKVVSLKPFVPLGHRIQMRNASSPVNLFTQKRYEYWSGCVSWGAQSGDYFVATKDPRPLEKFMRENGHYNVPDVVGKQDGETGGL